MRRISLALALIGAVAATGCSGGSKRSTDAGGNKGVGEGTFTVTVQNGQSMAAGLPANPSLAIRGGWITSTPAGIDCGISGHSACSATFAVGEQVVLTANFSGTDPAAGGAAYQYVLWAGDCQGDTTCSLTGNADKYVVAMLSGKRVAHPNYTDGKVHGPAFWNRAKSGLDCYACHGATLQGAGLAVGCGQCHAAPAPLAPTIKFSPAAPATGTIGQSLVLSALVTDPIRTSVTCTWSLASKPGGSAVSLSTSGTCSGAPGTASFVPDAAGVYVVRVTPNDGAGTLEATIAVAAQQFTDAAIGSGTATADAELSAIAGRLKAVLAKGYNNVAPGVLAKSLAGVDNANPRTTFAVVDVRLPEDFARGHIPGAVNVPLAQLPDVLLANPYFPETSSYTKKIIVAGYNAGDSTMGSVVFNSARWQGDNATGDSGGTGAAARPAWALKFGMSSWTFDLAASPTRFDNDENVRRYAAGTEEKNAVPTTPTYGYVAIGAFPGTPSLTQKILVRARTFLQGLQAEGAANPREAMWTTFVKLNELRNDGDPSNDPQVLDVRAAANYTAGHVPGAQFVAYQQVATLTATTTQMIDPSRKVFVYCVTGHTGGHATMALGIMGYKARNVLYGYNGWVASSMLAFDSQADANDFPLVGNTDCDLLAGVTGTQPTNPTIDPAATAFNNAACQVAYNPSRTGCTNCHRDYFAHFVDLTVKPIPGTTVEVASEGEG